MPGSYLNSGTLNPAVYKNSKTKFLSVLFKQHKVVIQLIG